MYVDDLLITGSDDEEIFRVKNRLNEALTINDLGSLIYFLGIEVASAEQGTLLNQRKFIMDILDSIGFKHCKAMQFTLSKGLKLFVEIGDVLTDLEPYRRLIRKILYILTSPSLAFHMMYNS